MGLWDDDDSSEDEDTPEQAERRTRAMQLLAQAFNKNPAPSADGAAPSAAAADEESRFLRSLLTTPADEVARCVRDRLSVLSVTRGGVRVTTSKKVAAAPAAAEPPPPPKLARLPKLLRRLSEGDVSAVSPQLLSDDYWAALVRELVGDAAADLVVRAERPSPPPASGELGVPSTELAAMLTSLNARGYGAVQPAVASWQWAELAPALSALRTCARVDFGPTPCLVSAPILPHC
jgi:hypothetical protein